MPGIVFSHPPPPKLNYGLPSPFLTCQEDPWHPAGCISKETQKVTLRAGMQADTQQVKLGSYLVMPAGGGRGSGQKGGV